MENFIKQIIFHETKFLAFGRFMDYFHNIAQNEKCKHFDNLKEYGKLCMENIYSSLKFLGANYSPTMSYSSGHFDPLL